MDRTRARMQESADPHRRRRHHRWEQNRRGDSDGRPQREGVQEGTVTNPDPVHEVTERLGAAADRLAELADEPVAEHVARYDALHGELQDALAAVDVV